MNKTIKNKSNKINKYSCINLSIDFFLMILLIRNNLAEGAVIINFSISIV